MNHRKCRFLACKKKKSLIFKEKKNLTSSYATFYLVRTLQFFFFFIDNWPQIQPKYQYLFHKNFPVRDFSIMTLISFISSIFQLFFKFFRQAETWNSAHRSSQLDLILPFLSLPLETTTRDSQVGQCLLTAATSCPILGPLTVTMV